MRIVYSVLISCFVTLAGTPSVLGQNNSVRLLSPDKELSLQIFEKDNRLSYSIKSGALTVVETSSLGLVIDGVDLGKNPRIILPFKQTKVKENYSLAGNQAYIKSRANEAEIFVETSGQRFSVIARVYNDGVALRYTIPEQAKRIEGEVTSWTLPAAVEQVAWSADGYEEVSQVTVHQKIPESRSLMGPLTWTMQGRYVSISEADVQTFPDMVFIKKENRFKAHFPTEKNGWEIKTQSGSGSNILNGDYKGKKVSPWRTTIVTKNLTDLVNSNLITNVCPPPAEGADFSWVKPGRCLWQWWSVGAPKLEDQRNWYDAAAKLKWEYYLVDDGWRNWKQPGKDQWQLLAEVVDYGKKVSVKSIVWVDSKEFRHAPERRAYLERVRDIGADGIKIDFIPDATSDIMQWYMATMQDCADLKLLVNFHGSVKPTGLQRTYPNDITREAVRGNEYQMTRYKRVLPLEHGVSVPFTRFLTGPADYTPVILDPKQLATAKFTWAHEFAQAIVYLSPVTHFADQYKFYVESPMFDLFQQIPTVWDETRVLSCTEIGEVVAFARRKGDVWWLGVMNGATEREIKIPLDFLSKNRKATLIYDGKIQASIDRREQEVSRKSVLTIKLQPGGGFVGRF